MDYFSGMDLGTGWDPKSGVVGWGSGETQNTSVQQAKMATDLFRQQFRNLIGRDPSSDELGKFQSQALQGSINAPGDLTYGDASGLSDAFIQQSFGPQAADFQKQTQSNELTDSQGRIQEIIDKMMGNTATALTDPNSEIYKTLSGSMNNAGLTPSSGAFQSGVGSTIANAGLGAANTALTSLGFPAISKMAGLSSVPYERSFGNGQSALTHLNDLGDFDLQSKIASMMASQSEPSGFEKGLGYASTASNILKNLSQSGGSAMSMAKATWICTQLNAEGLMSEEDIETLHDHLYKAFWKRPLKFLGYLMFGKLLVLFANKSGTNWRLWKSEFYDNVMAEPDSAKAVDAYGEAFWRLYSNVVNRNSLRKANVSL